MKKSKHKVSNKKHNKFMIFGVIATVILAVVLITLSVFKITSVEVVGNRHYTEEEIKDMVMQGPYTSNSLYLTWKYKSYGKAIPFISSIDVEMVSTHKVRIQVYEKDIIGYVEYLGSNVYFDKDGFVVESSNDLVEYVPCITGLEFPEITMGEKLPVEDETVFNTILNLTRFLKKTEIIPDKIFFAEDQSMTLYFGETKVLIGQDINMEEKISRLNSILPKLEGMAGKLHMENFSQDTKNFTFEKDKEEQEETQEGESEEGEENTSNENQDGKAEETKQAES